MRTKLLSAVLCICLFFSVLSGFDVRAVSEDTDRGEKAFMFLQAVGMLDRDIEYDSELTVDRGMFAKLAVCFSGNGPSTEKDSVFADIEESEYKQYIISAYEYGYISGADKTHFAPDTAVTYEQAVKIIMTILGYDPAARDMGGYPNGYMKAAAECDILKNTSGGGSLSMRNALILLYNAAHTDMMKLNLSGNKYEHVINEGETILTEIFGIYTCEGIINRTAYTDLLAQDSGIGKDMVSIGDTLFAAGGTNAEDYLGYYVTLYYDSSDNHSDYKAVYVEPDDKKSTYKLFENMQDIEIDGDVVKYYENGSLSEKMHVSPTASFIKNGKLSDMSISGLEKIEKGSVELISNDGDNTADVVRVTEYETHVVSGVSESTGVITTQDTGRIEVDAIDDDYDFRIVRDGADVSLSEIVPGSVILVAKSQGRGRNLKVILAGSGSVSGAVREKDADTVIIDGKGYMADKNVIENIKIGKNYICEIDALGYIAYARAENDIVYGYVYRITKDENDEVFCRIFTENDRWVELYFNDHVRLDGKTVRKEAAYEFLTNSLTEDWMKIIRYTVDKNARFKTIETAQSIAPGSAAEKAALDEDVFRKSISGKAAYKSGARSFGGQFFVDGSTKIMLIPSDLDKNKFGVSSVSELVNDKSYNVTVYDTDEYLTAGLLVITDNERSLGASSKMLIVKSGAGGVILNEDDDAVPMLEGYWKGDLISLPVKIGDDYVSQSDYNDLKKGDILQFTYDNKGNVVKILPHKADEHGNYQYSSLASAFSVIGGTVEGCTDSKINMTYTENGIRAGVALNTSTAVYLYDKANDFYKVCDRTEIMKGDRVMAVMAYLVCREIIVIR